MKNIKGFTLLELLAAIIILSILISIAVPMFNRYANDYKKLALFMSIKSIVNNISYNNEEECFYNYEVQDKDTRDINMHNLVVISYFEEDKKKFAVYSEIQKDVPFIDVSDFSTLDYKFTPNEWVLEDEVKEDGTIVQNTASSYFDKFITSQNGKMCNSVFGE